MNDTQLFLAYHRIYLQTAREVLEKESEGEENRTLFKKVSFAGVKMFNYIPDSQSREDDWNHFYLMEHVKNLCGFLTPGEFMNIFPPIKEFNGYKYGCKDYWSSMEEASKLDCNKPINEQVNPLAFMFEYHNMDIHQFNLNVMECLSNIRQSEGHISIGEEFMASQGMETPNTFKNSKGQAMYVRNGKLEAIEVKTNKLELVK